MSTPCWTGYDVVRRAVSLAICLACAGEVVAEEKQSAASEKRIAAARERAVLMHGIYQSTLDVMHERYFHNDRAVVPARAMEDIFEEMKHQTRVEAKWISASLEPMSLNHKPKTDFEKQAAAAISAGKAAVETVEGDYFRRATAIPLGAGCIACHQGFFRDGSKKPKFAGLVISVPLKDQIAAQQEPTEQTQSMP